MKNTRKVVVATSRDEMDTRIACAIRMRSNVTITVIDSDSMYDVSFRVTVTGHDNDTENRLNTVIGKLDSQETITVYIPSTGEITAVIQASENL